ncbi:MAG TPA: protein translocase subunit SecF [Candidatus Acidoferrales bacterium]|nr:protein translocase subunit SecF [Candidatus Acidoferrales bacterium]
MEFFHAPNIDWMGKAKYFVALSLALLVVGFVSEMKQGLAYGIDFKGGTEVTVRFKDMSPSAFTDLQARIRGALSQAGLPNSEIKPISDPADPRTKNDLVISLTQKTGTEESADVDAERQTVVNVLHKVLGADSASSKPDFNSTTAAEVATYLTQKDPLVLGARAGDRYTQLASALISARDTDYGGLVTDFNQLQSVSGVTPAVTNALANQYSLSGFATLHADTVGPTVGAQLRTQAINATLYALAGMLVYVAIRFSGGGLLRLNVAGRKSFFLWKWVDYGIFGIAAVIAVFHDVLITLGFFSLTRYEISLTVIAALLTLVGYSMNDTIVIFDRVRENLRLMRRESFPEIVNKSINQTLSRTILTSGLTLLTVSVLYFLGGQALRAFSFAMVVGVVVGTYSSFGIAAPLVVVWNKFRGGGVAAAPVRAGSAAEKHVAAVARR